MGAISHFNVEGERISGSSFGEPDGTEHVIDLLSGEGSMILRITLQDQKTVDLLFTPQQAVAFADAAEDIVTRLGSLPGYQRGKRRK